MGMTLEQLKRDMGTLLMGLILYYNGLLGGKFPGFEGPPTQTLV